MLTPPRPGLMSTMSTAIAAVRAFWTEIDLAAHAGPRAQGQHDGADHRHQQHQPGDLEVIDIVGIEDAAERLGVGDAGRRGAAPWRASAAGCSTQTLPAIDQLGHQDRGRSARRTADIAARRASARRNRCPASSPRTGTAPRPRRHRPRPGSCARNSAPSSTNSPAALKKARIRNSTECTGLRAAITMSAEAIRTAEKR